MYQLENEYYIVAVYIAFADIGSRWAAVRVCVGVAINSTVKTIGKLGLTKVAVDEYSDR